ncbi:polysaccharide lyase family 7 protein [Psychromonas algicola]|uniref:polysaccharide lyase family 7 protein n=1 Tax=Psychromonas algicola TaxID=2555642 RepID=UPI001FBBDF79|nr:polysaccharide lyase family 7 protein [Psychromonas sp. RZ5]
MKNNLTRTLFLALFLAACGDSGNGSSTSTTNSSIPYDYSKYRNALNNANLQQTDLSDCTDGDINESCSKSDVVDAGDYEDYSSEYFYVDKSSGWLTFEMEGKSNRTELRFTENFLTDSTETTYTLSAEILPISPTESVANSTDGEEITLLQVHNKGENNATDNTVLSHPLLRVVWDGESRSDDGTDGGSYSNAYWAIIKTNAYECSDVDGDNYNPNCPDSYDNFYLGAYDADNPTDFEVKVGNSQLVVNVDGTKMVDHDISYWAALYSYFKAGVYNQYTNGNSVVRFKTLTYSDGLLISELDSSLAPSANFDLSKWNLSVPIDNGEGDGYKKATTVTVEDLNDDYQLADYFWTDTSDGGMVFKDYIDGAITSKNTTYTRTELREMLRGTDTSISTQGVNGNNWVFSSVPTDLQNKAGGVDGNMVATLAVNHVTTTGKDSYVGRVIIGQIHAASDEPIRIYYRLLPGHTKGSVYFAHEPSNGNDEQWYEMIGSRDDDADEPSDGIELDEKFSYEIDVVGDIMTVTITREDGSTIEEEVDMSNSGYSDGYYTKDGVETEDYMYFKAGVYNQNKLVDEDEDGNDDYGAEADDYVQATFYYLTVSH